MPSHPHPSPGTVYTAHFMSLRALDGSYAAGGKYHTQIAKNLQPRFATAAGPVMNLNVFVLVSMLATARLAHYNRQPLTGHTYWAHLLGALGSLCQLCLPCCPCSTTMLYHTYTYQAFLAHYNAPKFFKELAGPKDGGSKLPRFNQVLTYTRVLLSIAHAGILEY